MATDSVDFVVCGRQVGRASGWDQGDTFSMGLHDFASSNVDVLPNCDCLWFNFDSGTIVNYDEDGEVVQSFDLIETLAQFPRAA